MAKILIVEDDTLLQNMYATKFKKDGFEVSTAGNGEAGLSKIKSDKPDLVLLDIMMPKMNGLEVLTKMKADNSISGIPVIMLTNLARGDDDVNKGLELGAVAYLVKSKVAPTDVVARVKQVLKSHGKDIELTSK